MHKILRILISIVRKLYGDEEVNFEVLKGRAISSEDVHIVDDYGNLKFTKKWTFKDISVFTPSGYTKVKYLLETIPYEVFELETKDGLKLRCADTHIVIDSSGNECFVKDLTVGSMIESLNGYSEVVRITNTGHKEVMYDLELAE